MTGGRCHRRKKMTAGRGAEAEAETPADVSRVPAGFPARSPENGGVDFYAQARKALCLRSPFDGADEAAPPAAALTLPSGVAVLLLRQSDSRKRHKKSHSGAGNKNKKSSASASRSKVPNVWALNEEYFRDLTMLDIDRLSEASELSSGSVGSRKCLLIPVLGVAKDKNLDGSGNGNENIKSEKENGNTDTTEDKHVVENVVVVEMKKEEHVQSMEIDGVEDESLPQKEKSLSVSEPARGLEWLLGIRNKGSQTSERPSKKRKLVSGDTGLEKVLVSCSCDGNSSLCHFCSTGNSGKDSNQLISCSACRVSVHRNCYGVQGDETSSSWLCSWCKQKSIDGSKESENPCVLCPKKGGALKPVSRRVEKGNTDFAHLFCSLWAPEVYIEDLVKMEPIKNVESVIDVRKKMICNICKVKGGACVRCSHGACRISFHPLCAREVKHRLEVWGRYGCDNVELRAFCLKHSEVLDNSKNASQAGETTVVAGSNTDSIDNLPEKNVGCRNGDNSRDLAEAPDSNSDRSFDTESQGTVFPSSKLNDRHVAGCNVSQSLNDTDELGRCNDNISATDASNFALIWKKLVDLGRINIEDVASQIGMSLDSLSASLADDTISPDVQHKIAKWLKDHVLLNAYPRKSKVKTRSMVSCKAEFGDIDDSVTLSVSEADIVDRVAVKSAQPRRRTKCNIRISNDPKTVCSPQGLSDTDNAMNEVNMDQLINKKLDKSDDVSIPHAVEKNLTELEGAEHATVKHGDEGCPTEPSHSIPQESNQVEEVSVTMQGVSVREDGAPTCTDADLVGPGFQKTEVEAVPSFYIHPDIQNKVLQMKDSLHLSSPVVELNNGSAGGEEASADGSICSTDKNKHPICEESSSKDYLEHSERLLKATETGILGLAPQDEVEGEILYYQHKLLSNAFSRKALTGLYKLITSVAKGLPQEIDLSRTKSWDAVLVNKYLHELREAKKQGRKERRHKEAQAVLAAATAAAAASSRISSFRKDGDESTNPGPENTTTGRSGSSSQPIPRAKETLQRVAAPRISLEKHSDANQSVVDFSKEHPRLCDICRRSETLLNPILVCCSCKVAVHLDCYRSVKESTGPWYCELCEELSLSRSSGAPAVNFWEKPYFVAECGLCGGSTGAFRKSSDGQWVHAFCAEWVFESKFKRGQVKSVEGMETVSKGDELCQICHRKHGVCIKCNYGHCQATFHPWCGRSAGFYMNVKTSGGKLQHKAYCEKHSTEQKAKAETQKHGAEELKSLRQVRVELERLRLLCERLIKREKLKRELVLCSHDILAVKRDHVARSKVIRSSYVIPDISSESVTTSLRGGQTDDYKSCSEALQRSDDVTVDSTVSVRRRGRVSGTTDDHKIEDDCSTSQNQVSRKPSGRSQVSGKQIPNRPSSVTTRNLTDESWRSKSKKQETTIEKEIVMTSDQASVKNMLLPKGFAYVPADCLSNEKQPNQDSVSVEPSEHGG